MGFPFNGDLVPVSSGFANLGINVSSNAQNAFDGMQGSIRPFNHIHQVSGIFHDPLYGQSGVLRFSQRLLAFEVSIDGGLTFEIVATGTSFGVDTLQEAYEGNEHIFTSAAQGGGVKINGNSNISLNLRQSESASTYPHINMSGLISRIPSEGLDRGTLWMQNHTAGWEAQLSGGGLPTSQEEANARSLGPALLFYHNGSGVTNLVISSGIQQFYNTSALTINPTEGLNLHSFTAQNSDAFYNTVDASGVKFNVAGAYKLNFAAELEKTEGNLRQSILASLRVRDNFGQEFSFVGSENTVSVRDSADNNGAHIAGTVLADIEIGEAIYYNFSLLGDGVVFDNVIRLAGLGGIIQIEYMGPKRFGKINRQKRI